ncbi:MAG: hypothetical protein ACKVP7_26320 [Hyphomicrobiaceae bacterium]
MDSLLVSVLLLAMAALAVVAGIWVIKSYMNGQSPTAAIFGPRPEPRLGVVEQASVDGRRRLLLVRRDGVEHLIMTGGPVDMVIETGIGEPKARGHAIEAPQTATVFTRSPRPFGQATTAAPERAAE